MFEFDEQYANKPKTRKVVFMQAPDGHIEEIWFTLTALIRRLKGQGYKEVTKLPVKRRRC